jgi:hypothetical protein
MIRFWTLTTVAVGVATAALSCQLPAAATAVDPITEWSLAASAAAPAGGMAPLRTPITLALVHLAMYDAVNAVLRDHDPYGAAPPVVRPASAHAAAVEAGYRVLLAEFPTEHATLAAVYRTLRGTIPDGPAKENGAAVGALAADQLLALRANDGRNVTPAHVPASGPGAWLPTPPAFLPATTKFLSRVTPFTMESPSQFRPSGPTDLSSRHWIRDYNEVKAFGVGVGSMRSEKQTKTAWFWEPFAGTVWPATIRRLAAEQMLDLADSARFQAAAFAAFADGLIACWDAKFHYNFWRPVTAIQHGDTDETDRTEIQADWQPLAVTPNFPEYPSGHACATAAVTNVIEDFFGHDVLIPARNVVTGEERFYRNANDAVNEVIEARMLLGVHFRSSNEDGADIGRRVARHIRSRWFKPRG